MSGIEHRVDRLQALTVVSERAACRETHDVLTIVCPGRPRPKPRRRALCGSCGGAGEEVLIELSFDPGGGGR